MIKLASQSALDHSGQKPRRSESAPGKPSAPIDPKKTPSYVKPLNPSSAGKPTLHLPVIPEKE